MVGPKNMRSFWDERAQTLEHPGTDDLIADQIESEVLFVALAAIGHYSRVVDVGCGTGDFIAKVAKRNQDVECVGIDFSEAMIARAQRAYADSNLSFKVGSVLTFGETADVIITKRTIVNLQSWREQKDAILHVLDQLAPCGTYLMLENSEDGLLNINVSRVCIGLKAIARPEHNCYLRDKLVNELISERIGWFLGVEHYSGTYYFLSRVINAWMAKNGYCQDRIKEPRYSAEINTLALALPRDMDTKPLSQGRLWRWRKPG